MGHDGGAEPDERVSVASLHAYCIRLCEAAGMPPKDAATLATFLVEQDVVQGGRMSHGTRCLAGVAATDRPGWQDYLRRMMPSHELRPSASTRRRRSASCGAARRRGCTMATAGWATSCARRRRSGLSPPR